jgi:HlyD family secretion protein
MMRKKTIIIILSIIVIAVLAYILFFPGDDKVEGYTFAKITRGDISNTITATGTLDALTKVDVGTQVSGIIAKIYVDFNDEVKKGQLLALIDTTFLSAQVRDANAGLSRATAQYEESLAKNQRNKQLYEKGFLSELDYLTSQTSLKSDSASLNSAESALQRAQTNLDYAFIVAPMSGKVINRNVEQGQTVAASFSTPTLFTITDDLKVMKILINVDESDIGQIKLGQNVQFTVEAYPNKKFSGKVVQIRLNPETIQNVVNYTVVVNADNSEKLLLPGMTATADFYIDQRKDVLLVPNAALRLQPTEDMLAEAQKQMEQQMANLPDSIKNRFNGRNRNSSGNPSAMGGGGNPFTMGGRSSSGRSMNFGSVWYLNDKGQPEVNRLVLGITDGKNTEIVRSRDIKEGMNVITSVIGNNQVGTNNSNSRNNLPRGFGRVF